jgi:hypothetical protein
MEDPRAALALINEFAISGYRRQSLQAGVFSKWAESAPREAVCAALELATARERREALESIARTWAEHDHAAVIQWAESLPDVSLRNSALNTIIDTLTSKNEVQIAAALALKLPVNEFEYPAVARVADAWARTDLAKATEWVLRLPAGYGRRESLTRLCHPMAQADPQQAIQFAFSRPDGDGRVEMLRVVVSEWAEQDPAAARGWALALTDSKVREEVLPQLFSAWVGDDMEGALAAFGCLDGGDQKKAAASMMYALVTEDAVRAATWAIQLPDEATRAEMVSVAASQWARSDVDAFTRWTQSLPAGAARDSAVYALACRLDNQPEALRWALSIGEQEKRHELIALLVGQWREREPDAASRWLAEAKLPDELRERLK